MSPLHALTIFVVGILAGAVNTIVGSGTLLTFPLLLGFGYAPVLANVSNTIGLVPGSAAGAIGYRRELRGQGGRLRRLAGASVLGGCLGGALLLIVPGSAFAVIVIVFIVIAVIAVVAEPVLSRVLAGHRPKAQELPGPVAAAVVFIAGVYGGYFGAAQGILVLAVLSLALDDDLQRLNALKVVLVGLVNLVAGIVFICVAQVAWGPTGLIAAGSLIGGTIGARAGRRLPISVLRAAVVIVGIVAIIRLVGS